MPGLVGRAGGVWLPWVVGVSHSGETGSHFSKNPFWIGSAGSWVPPEGSEEERSQCQKGRPTLAPGHPPGTTSLDTSTSHPGWAGLRSLLEDGLNLSFWPCPDVNRQGSWEPPVHPAPAPRTLTSVGTLSQMEIVCFLGIHLTGREERGVRVLRASCGFHLPRGGVPSELSQGWVRPGDRNGALSGGGSPGELPSMDCHTGASLPLSRGHPHSVAQARSPGGGISPLPLPTPHLP